MDYYSKLDNLIRIEIERKQRIAIYPLGKVGLQAKDILVNRYGIKEFILIDNNLAKYNNQIIDLKCFLKIDRSDISIIICTTDNALNRRLYEELREKKIKAKVKNILETYRISQHPDKPEYFKRIKELLQVQKAIDYELIRVGKNHDGGYIMLNDFRHDYIAYSFGIGWEISWDRWIADCGINVYCYDHTIERLPQNYHRLNFNKVGISGSDDIKENLLSLPTILYRNGHMHNKNLILKMDVEGSEWEFINSISSDVLKQFLQISFELHDLTDINNSKKVISALEKLNETHQVVWIHANNNGEVGKAADILIPNLLEVTYANREQYTFKPTIYNCPLNIDYPNIEDRHEIELKNWGKIGM